MIETYILVAACSALLLATSQAVTTAVHIPPFIPLNYKYGGYPKISANVLYGNPGDFTSVPTVMDLGSANYWVRSKNRVVNLNYGFSRWTDNQPHPKVYGPNATVNYGSPYLGQLGPCNITAKPFFNYPASKTATKPVAKDRAYSYGGNGKIVSSYFALNDTIHFSGKGVPAIKNVNVAIANFTLVRVPANNCKNSDSFEYDKSILGLSRYHDPTFRTVGPSFRQDLLNTDQVKTSSFSMWFDKTPKNVKSAFRGTALFGAVATDKYQGRLVYVKPSPPKVAYVGYYFPGPMISTNSVDDHAKETKLGVGKSGMRRCLVDSGTGNDLLPISQKQFLKGAGLILYKGYPAYNGSCDSLPRSAALTFTFPGLTSGKPVNISVPLRNYARGNTDFYGNKNKCSFSMELLESQACVLGAPFSTALFLAVNDDKNQIAIAQGGVSTGARRGAKGLGKFTVLKPGDSIPGAV